MSEQLFNYLNGLAMRSSEADAWIIFGATFLGIWMVAGLFAYFYFAGSTRRAAINVLATLLSAVLAWIIADFIKLVFWYPRPFEVFEGVHQLITHGGGDAFPSGHAAFYGALAFAVLLFSPRLAVVYLAGAVIIGVSRIIAGIHWPADVLMGYAIGALCAAAVSFTFQKLKHKLNVEA